ncbi:hypothetical protein [[Flexibacter] sp. ATCC 35208]|uniref:hypothetical protein n=1 Tax=[Flexibacter] sp. ATCC 35208 TaxID=1936242 RepID=UPI0015C40281|nr:hypothetical protein [[Flexibacter] sp. ATCC 35208]
MRNYTEYTVFHIQITDPYNPIFLPEHHTSLRHNHTIQHPYRQRTHYSVVFSIKIADVLAVSIDYLVGKTNLVLDKATLKQLEDINTLPEEARGYILNHIDMMIRDFKNKTAYNHK